MKFVGSKYWHITGGGPGFSGQTADPGEEGSFQNMLEWEISGFARTISYEASSTIIFWFIQTPYFARQRAFRRNYFSTWKNKPMYIYIHTIYPACLQFWHNRTRIPVYFLLSASSCCGSSHFSADPDPLFYSDQVPDVTNRFQKLSYFLPRGV